MIMLTATPYETNTSKPQQKSKWLKEIKKTLQRNQTINNTMDKNSIHLWKSEHNKTGDLDIPQVSHDNPIQIFCQRETHSGGHIL